MLQRKLLRKGKYSFVCGSSNSTMKQNESDLKRMEAAGFTREPLIFYLSIRVAFCFL